MSTEVLDCFVVERIKLSNIFMVRNEISRRLYALLLNSNTIIHLILFSDMLFTFNTVCSLLGFIFRLISSSILIYLSIAHVKACFSRTFTLNLFAALIPNSLILFLDLVIFFAVPYHQGAEAMWLVFFLLKKMCGRRECFGKPEQNVFIDSIIDIL